MLATIRSWLQTLRFIPAADAPRYGVQSCAAPHNRRLTYQPTFESCDTANGLGARSTCMTFGYADKLSYREDLGGSLGDPEYSDSGEELAVKVEQLAALVKNSKRITAFTGAGISKAAGVPDFRGPTGIWTLQRAGLPIPKLDINFGAAKPSITHQFLVALQQAGKLTCVISQNVDGLHTRSGIERERLAELHGSCFVEKCSRSRCGREYVREFELDTVGFKRTGRRCECGGALKDNCLDWENPLPEADHARAIQAAQQCDLMLCLGSSLRIVPACELPENAVDAGAKLAIINLQETQHDKIAHVHMHAKCEEVIGRLATLLGLVPLPHFQRQDTVQLTFIEELPAAKASTGFEIRLSSPHSQRHISPMVQSASVSFPDDGLEGECWVSRPFQLRRRIGRINGNLRVRVQLHLSHDADADKREVALEAEFRLGPPPKANATPGQRAAKRLRLDSAPQTHTFSFPTQHVQY